MKPGRALPCTHQKPGAFEIPFLNEGVGIEYSLGLQRWFSTKVRLRVNADGMPIAVEATPGQAHDVTAYDDLMDQRDSDPGALLADKRYDSDAIRQDLRDRGASPEIPTKRKRNRTVRYAVETAL